MEFDVNTAKRLCEDLKVNYDDFERPIDIYELWNLEKIRGLGRYLLKVQEMMAGEVNNTEWLRLNRGKERAVNHLVELEHELFRIWWFRKFVEDYPYE